MNESNGEDDIVGDGVMCGVLERSVHEVVGI